MEQYYHVIEQAYNISLFSHVIPLVVVIFRLRFLNFSLKIASINVLRGFVITSIGLYFYYTNQSNRLLFYISPSLDIVLVSLLATAIFDFRKELKWGLALVCILFITLMIYDYLNSNTLLSSYLSTIETLFVIIISVFMLRKIALQYKSSIYKRSLIWIITALLVSNLFAFLIASLNEIIMGYSSKFLHFIWYLSSPLFIVITNLMVAYGFYIIRNKVREA